MIDGAGIDCCPKITRYSPFILFWRVIDVKCLAPANQKSMSTETIFIVNYSYTMIFLGWPTELISFPNRSLLRVSS